MSILIIAEHDHSRLNPAVLTTLDAAKQIGGDIDILVAGHNCSAAADEAAKADGVAKVLKADDPAYSHFLAENMAALIVEQVKTGGYSHVLAPATTTGKNILPRVAALLDMQQISDIIGIESADTFIRPIYAGNAIATVQSHDEIKIITVRGTAFERAEAEGGSAVVEDVQISADANAGLSGFVSQELTESVRPELTAAGVVISGGRGVGSAENFKIIEDLADKLGGAVGASRAAVDAGYVPNDYQVGQTGKVVAPELYIAVGISGAIQHLAGMKDSKIIVAINKDADAPIFQIADYGLVADLFEAIPALQAALEKLSDAA
jgi:electron transfer flavoprotein alpha subunit